MTPEAKIKKEITAYLKSVGAWYDMPVRMGYGRRGVPDILVCYRGFFLGLEVKVQGRQLDPWQKREIAAIQAAGGRAAVVTSVAEVEGWISFITVGRF